MTDDDFEVHPLPRTDDDTIARFGLFRYGALVGHVVQRAVSVPVEIGDSTFTQVKRVWVAETVSPAAHLGEFPSRAAALKAAKAAVA